MGGLRKWDSTVPQCLGKDGLEPDQGAIAGSNFIVKKVEYFEGANLISQMLVFVPH